MRPTNGRVERTSAHAQFLFDPDEFAYIKKNWVFLDHDQRFTGSAGISYTWNDWQAGIDGLYGNGLRQGFANTQKTQSLRDI